MNEPTLGMKIRAGIERRRWSQQQLADAVGVSLRTVNDWVNDRANPRSSIAAIEDVLGIQLRTASQADAEARAVEHVRRLLAGHGPDVTLPDEWIDRLVDEYKRLLSSPQPESERGEESA